MSKPIDQQIQALIDKKIVPKLIQLQKAVALTTFQYITANSLTVGMQYGSPVLTGRYYNSHRITLDAIDTSSVAPENVDGEDKPYKGLPLSFASKTLQGVKLGTVVYISNALPYAQKLEQGWSRYKAPEGVYGVSTEAVTAKFRNVKRAMPEVFKT